MNGEDGAEDGRAGQGRRGKIIGQVRVGRVG
jgi:hypothetical protein